MSPDKQQSGIGSGPVPWAAPSGTWPLRVSSKVRGAASKDTLKSGCEADPLPLSTSLPKFFACSSRQECLVSSFWPLGLQKPQSLPVWFFSLFPPPGQGEVARLCYQQGPLFARSSRRVSAAARASHGTSGPTRQVPRAPSRASSAGTSTARAAHRAHEPACSASWRGSCDTHSPGTLKGKPRSPAHTSVPASAPSSTCSSRATATRVTTPPILAS